MARTFLLKRTGTVKHRGFHIALHSVAVFLGYITQLREGFGQFQVLQLNR